MLSADRPTPVNNTLNSRGKKKDFLSLLEAGLKERKKRKINHVTNGNSHVTLTRPTTDSVISLCVCVCVDCQSQRNEPSVNRFDFTLASHLTRNYSTLVCQMSNIASSPSAARRRPDRDRDRDGNQTVRSPINTRSTCFIQPPLLDIMHIE